MSNTLPLVSIVTVNYNGKAYLKDCFKACKDLEYPKNKLEIIMVDNCSSDDSAGYVAKHFPEVTIVKNDINNYARANNLGIAHSKGAFIAFVNNDVRLHRTWLRKLVDILQKEARAGIVGGKLLFKDHKIQSTGIEEYPDYYWGDRGFRLEDKGQFEHIEEVPSLCGAALLARRKCFADAGVFDEDFVIYLEDVDMCFRCAKKGWKILYVPGAIAYHHFHGTNTSELVRYLSERNRLLMLAKHYPEKLADMFYGKGYFSAVPGKKKQYRIYDVLPDIITKLFSHHGMKSIVKILPDVFKSLGRIVDLEKSILVDRLTEVSRINTELLAQKEELARDLSAKDSLLTQQQAVIAELSKAATERNKEPEELSLGLQAKNAELSQLQDSLARLTQRQDELTQQLIDKDSLLTQQQVALAELSQLQDSLARLAQRQDELTQQLIDKDSLLTQQQDAITEFSNAATERNSQIDGLIKGLKTKDAQVQKLRYELALLKSDLARITGLDKKMSFLVIKPQPVSVEDTQVVIKAITQKYPNASVDVFAHLVPQDYEALSKNTLIRKLYSAEKDTWSLMEMIKFSLTFCLKRFDVALVLLSQDRTQGYNGYRMAKLMGLLSASKSLHTYYVK